MPPAALITEFLVLFVAMPLAYRFAPWTVPALPVLWVVALYCYWQLRRDATFDRSRLWNPRPFAAQFVSIIVLFLTGALLLYLGVRLFEADLLFNLVRAKPRVWATLMVFYPILSVYPQGIIYRSFLMHRYASLLSSEWTLILASATAFSFMHIVYQNPIAVTLTFVGGLIFARRYSLTKSLLTSSAEHALYGCWLFTVGLGDFFYHGRAQLQ
jgi:membrane protease YdiL (CAAX protease family)